MRCITMLLLALAVITQCHANDTLIMGTGGSMRPMAGEDGSIRMVREWVRMDVYPKYYDVSAQFVFRNEGPATTIRMGFPEFNTGSLPRGGFRIRSGFTSFRTTVDGQRVSARRVFLDDPESEFQQRAYWVKTVHFSQNQERVVRVEYRSNGGYNTGGERFAEYHFTGRNWAGTVDESSITTVMHTPGTYYMRNLPSDTRMVGNRFSNRWTNWQADNSFDLVYAPTFNGAMILHGNASGFENMDEFFITQPGRTPAPAWVSDVIMRNGISFIRMQSLRNILDGHSRKYNLNTIPSKRWDPKTQSMSLDTDNHHLAFQVGKKEMQADGCSIELPAAPFRLMRVGYIDPGIYVPLRPVANALGIYVNVNTKTRVVRLEIPS